MNYDEFLAKAQEYGQEPGEDNIPDEFMYAVTAAYLDGDLTIEQYLTIVDTSCNDGLSALDAFNEEKDDSVIGIFNAIDPSGPQIDAAFFSEN